MGIVFLYLLKGVVRTEKFRVDVLRNVELADVLKMY